VDKIAGMIGKTPGIRLRTAACIGGALLTAMLAACSTVGSTVDRLKGPKEGATSDVEARNVSPDDPLAAPIQLGWTSARASHCGFVFNPDQLKTDFLAAEQRLGMPPEQIEKIAKAYDYTRQSVLDSIKNDNGYCNKERLAAIRTDLNRYLAGDYSPTARMAR
jgi:hypothetical protein